MKTRIGVLTAWLMSLLTMQAAVETWDGGHSSANGWYANLNWLDDTAPIDGDSLVFTGTAWLTHYAYGNLGSPSDGDFDVVGITFDAAAGAFVINNGGGGTITLQGGITNDSSNLQTLNFPFMITNGNARVDTASGNITINGNISDDGSSRGLYKIGTGTLTLSGVNTYGYTKISTVNGPPAGTVLVESSSSLGSGSFEFESAGTLELGAYGLNIGNVVRVLYRDGDLGPRIIRLDLAGANTGELSGTVDLRWHHASGFFVDVGVDDTLTLSGTIERQAGGGVLNVIKTGAGTMILSGDNTYSGATIVSNGTLLVNNTSGSGTGTGSVNVKNGATLGGTGSISGLVTVDSGGHVAPGTSIDTLTMTGGLTLNFGSILDFEADADSPANDKIAITAGTFTGTGTGGVTVNANVTGTLAGSTTFTLMEWVAATGVEVGDFNLVMTGVGAGTLSIEGGNTLVLTAAPAGTILTIQ